MDLPEESTKENEKASNDEQSKEALKIVNVVKSIDPSVFRGINPKQRTDIVRSVISVSQFKSHSGPIPDPEDIIQYDQVIPNGADRIMIMAEKEQDFRHKHTMTISKRKLNQSGLGQIFGFLISISVVGGGIYLLSTGQSLAGFATIIIPIAGIITAFVYTRKTETK